ncbi:MAG: UDP-N-acetylenolpyruvoylglucosamine reductase [Butyrivibrio sp.]|nr:UDP-N-acetylenolpyruvoylglucosamine reductase [Acetatifactor muris]MCM1558722.1 UDP-N-acetylenolpyruvoylglucosamine reductase [Butyrivibrio sp.]
MTAIRKDAINLLEQMPEDKLHFIVQIMQGISGLYGTEDQAARDRAFEELESLRRKVPLSEYDAELEKYREEKYGAANIN